MMVLLGKAKGYLILLALAWGCGSVESHHAPGGEDGGERFLNLPGVVNARDFGGWPTPQGDVGWGIFLRGGELTALGADCSPLEPLGLATVIDLRDDASPEPACLTARPVLAPMPKILPPTAESYLATLQGSPGAIKDIFQTLSQPGGLPTYIHCVIGRDRASVVSSLILLALGVSREDVLREFMLSNEAGIDVEESWIQAVMDEVEAGGGIEAYLQGLGVEAGVLEGLREAGLAP